MNELKRRTENAFPFVKEEFVSPPDCFYPAYTWVWNDKIDEEVIRKRLDAMKKAGIRATYVLPESKRFRPFTMRTYMEPDYLTDEFMRLTIYAIRYADSIGIRMWLYDEDGWPSGYASGEVIKKYPDLVRKWMVKDENGNITRKMGEGYWTVDSLDDRVGEAFVKEVHEKYEKAYGSLLGNEIPMIFTDEPGTGNPAYPFNVEEKFLKKYGYDMTPYKEAIIDASSVKTEEERKARIDYYMLLGELFRDNYFGPIKKWCEKVGILSGGHLDLDNQTDGCTRHAYGSVLPLLREMHLPGVDVIWRQIFPPKADGQSPTKEGNEFFPRFASSAAHQIGNRLSLTESFAIYGSGLKQDEMRYVIGYQLVRGVNLFNMMSASNSKNGALPFVARPSFVSEIPGYDHQCVISDYTARGSYLMSLGFPGTDTALYFPARDLHAGGEIKENAMKAFDALGKKLEQMHLDFDIIDDEGILKAKEENGCLTLGLSKYKHIVIPECRYMPENVRAIAEKYPGVGEKAIDVEGENILARKRVLENGDEIVFVFNQNGRPADCEIKLPENKKAYRLNLITGCIKPFSGGKVSLETGADVTLILTNEDICACCEKKLTKVMDVTEFDLTKVREACAEPVGIREYYHPEAYFHASLGGWDKYFGMLYAGEARYKANIELPMPITSDYILSLGKVEDTARVYVNGKEVGTAALTPKCVKIPLSALPADGKIELVIEVANSLANQTANMPVEEYYPQWETGGYNVHTKPAERESMGGGLFGPVEIFKAE